MEKCAAVLSGRYVLLWIGTALAGTHPWQYVSAGRRLLSYAGQGRGTADEYRLPGGFGRPADHSGRTGGGAAGQPPFSGLGLPQHATELLRPDMPAVHALLDAAEPCGIRCVPTHCP